MLPRPRSGGRTPYKTFNAGAIRSAAWPHAARARRGRVPSSAPAPCCSGAAAQPSRRAPPPPPPATTTPPPPAPRQTAWVPPFSVGVSGGRAPESRGGLAVSRGWGPPPLGGAPAGPSVDHSATVRGLAFDTD